MSEGVPLNEGLLADPPDAVPSVGSTSTEKVGDVAAEALIRSVEIFAWRDLDHPEAGGSEVHAARIAERWAAAGLDVTLTASRAPGASRRSARDGYRVARRSGRYLVFPAAAARGLMRQRAQADAVVEVWNGMPFFSPLWSRRPRMTFLHHVHGGMWDLVMPRPLAELGKLLESRIAPAAYRREQIVTLSESSRQVIVRRLGLDPSLVKVIPPGVDPVFQAAPRRQDAAPLVVAVGRLVPYKRFDRLIEVLVQVHARHPSMRAVIAGEGSERAALESLIRRRGAEGWLSLPGRLEDTDLLDLYQRAWVLTTASEYEGWGLTISEAAACGVPSVATPITGHMDAVVNGYSGYLAEPGEQMVSALDALIGNEVLRHRLHLGALATAARLSWDRAALEAMKVLAASYQRPSRC